jgi:GT2 family glycosyltransferase
MAPVSGANVQQRSVGLAPANPIDVTVAICTWTPLRWDWVRIAIDSVSSQQPPPREILLVVDHNPELAARAREELHGVRVLESEGERGISGARNTCLHASRSTVTVFLDDDAVARPGWLSALIAPYEDPDVIATGGSIFPLWPERAPRWMAPEFYWVVGCTYRGLPETTGPIRNPIGASMSMLTAAAIEIGGFDSAVGRIGFLPAGCEETELAIRLTQLRPQSTIIYVPDSAVDHHVSTQRVRVRYLLNRCWKEGISKAITVRLVGAKSGLELERRHAAVTIPAALLREVRGALRGDLSAAARAATTVAGLAAAVGGFAIGCVRLLFGRRRLRRRMSHAR